jgi:hypothetical protein
MQIVTQTPRKSKLKIQNLVLDGGSGLRYAIFAKRERGCTMARKLKCRNKDGEAEYLLINGEEQEKLCSVCFEDSVIDLVTNSDSVSFRQEDEKKNGLKVFRLE